RTVLDSRAGGELGARYRASREARGIVCFWPTPGAHCTDRCSGPDSISSDGTVASPIKCCPDCCRICDGEKRRPHPGGSLDSGRCERLFIVGRKMRCRDLCKLG